MQSSWIKRLLVLVGLLSTISCRTIPVRGRHFLTKHSTEFNERSLEKRIQTFPIGFPATPSNGGNPVTAADVQQYIDEIAEIADLIVRTVHPNHAVFLRFFGAQTYYEDVMGKASSCQSSDESG